MLCSAVLAPVRSEKQAKTFQTHTHTHAADADADIDAAVDVDVAAAAAVDADVSLLINPQDSKNLFVFHGPKFCLT